MPGNTANNQPELVLNNTSRWLGASMIMGWSSNFKKLQDFILGRTFAPHWREFEVNWLNSNNTKDQKVPPFEAIIPGCMRSCESGRNDYYIVQPDASQWSRNDGLGHYIRLLTMIVRENMATNGIWEIANGETLRKYFEMAFLLVNCMRDEWLAKDKLYEHFRATNQGKYQDVLLRYAQTSATSRLTNEPLRASGRNKTPTGQGSSEATTGDSKLTTGLEHRFPGYAAPPRSQPAQAPEYPVKQETSAEKGNNFLDSLEAELARKGADISIRGQATTDGTEARKRLSEDEGAIDSKRRKQDETNVYHSPDTASASAAAGPAKVADMVGIKQESSPNGHASTTSPTKTTRSGFTPYENTKPRYPDYPDHRGNMMEYRSGYTSFYPNGRGESVPPPASRDNGRPYHSSYGKPPPTTYPGRPGTSREFSNEYRGPKPPASEKPERPRPPFIGPRPPKNVMEERILETCPYELKGLQCPKKQDCNMMKVCLSFSRGDGCKPNCPDSHVLRTCKYKATAGYCSKESGQYSGRCTFGHEEIRGDISNYPARYHKKVGGWYA